MIMTKRVNGLSITNEPLREPKGKTILTPPKSYSPHTNHQAEPPVYLQTTYNLIISADLFLDHDVVKSPLFYKAMETLAYASIVASLKRAVVFVTQGCNLLECVTRACRLCDVTAACMVCF